MGAPSATSDSISSRDLWRPMSAGLLNAILDREPASRKRNSLPSRLKVPSGVSKMTLLSRTRRFLTVNPSCASCRLDRAGLSSRSLISVSSFEATRLTLSSV